MPGTGNQQAMGEDADIKGAFSSLAGYLGAMKWPVIIAVVFSFAGAILNLMGPSRLGEVTDLITAGLTGDVDIAAIEAIAWVLVGLYVGGLILNYAQGFIMATVSQRISQNMRRDISEKIDRLPLRYLDSHPTGDTLSRVTNDVDTVGQTMNQSLSTLVSSICQLVGALILMLATNVLMTVAGVVATIIGVVLVIGLVKKSQPHFTAQQEELGDINGQVEEIYDGLDVVRTHNGEDSAQRRFHATNDRLYEAAWKSSFLSGLNMPIMIFIGNLSYVAVCVTGAVLAMSGQIEFGVIVSFMLYIRLFTQPLQNISQAATSVQSMAAACQRVFDFLAEDEVADESDKTERIEKVEGRVTFHHVKFGYEPDRTIINDFTATAQPGQKVAIVGPTGAGKTTIVNLLERFYEVDEGRITLDGKSTLEVPRADVRNQFGMVLQDTWIFEGTLRENLVFDTEGVTDDKLDEACEACGLTGYVDSLPDRYDTKIDDSSAMSAGQRQLITIARAMLKDAPLLILDEATSSVDTRTELKVQKAMDTLMEGRTSFVIAHRLSTIRDADMILVMEHGDIVEKGDHEELLAKGGAYAKLYNSQFDESDAA
ncbi:MAG: ABC transporter ATP-binding protein/permease [Atopobiaceae bacterium]|jgi:ATP-binding cassette subfamily B protein|nr:ABC transporter ATP-binding protein/permease [Atopobiaceae bacterium]